MSGSLAPPITFQGYTGNGALNAFGYVATYAAGTTTPIATYADSTLGTPNTNPVQLNAVGQAPIWLTPGLLYKFVETDQAGNQCGYVDQISAPLTSITALMVGNALYPILFFEVGVTNTVYPYGDIRRYGADTTGVADSTTPINNAITSWYRVYVPSATYKCSGSINLRTGTTMYGDGPTSVLQYTNGNLNNIVCNTLTGVVITDLKINITGTGASPKIAGIYLKISSQVVIERVTMAGCNWSGVWLDTSSYCTVRSCNFSAFSEPAGVGGDIIIYNVSSGGTVGSNFNVFDDNTCNGGGGYGIAIIDPYAATLGGFPSNNKVINNTVGAHLSYGLLLYMPGATAPASDTYNEFMGNTVQSIAGTCPTNTDSGAGIYLAGLGIGATKVIGNDVFNCCIHTLTRTLAPGGIGVNAVAIGVTPPTIQGNTVDGMQQGDGILIAASPGGAIVVGNTINMPSSNNGTGSGGAPLVGDGIRVDSSSDVVIGPNTVRNYGTGRGLNIYAGSAHCTGVDVTGGLYLAANIGAALQASQVGGYNVQQLTITGGKYRQTYGSAGSYDALSINTAIGVNLVNVYATTVVGRGLFLNGTTSFRMSGGYCASQAGTNIATSGTCTNGFIDKSVNCGITTGASGSLINNAGTGCNIEQNFSSVPTAGTWVTGDRAVHLGDTVGTAKAWARVTSGSGNVLTTDWISEGNL